VVKCTSGRAKPKFYEATDRKYAYVKWIKSGIAPNACRLHLVACRAMILKPPWVPPRWTRTWQLPNGTQYFSRKELLDVGTVTFTRIQSPGKDQLIIFMPEKRATSDELKDYKERLEAYTQRAANWFMKRYDCQLGLLELYQKPHFAFPETNEIAAIAKKLNLSWKDFWIDDSEGQPEWETKDLELAMAKAEAPQRLLRLEDKVTAMEETTNRIISSIDRLENKIDELLNLSQTPIKPPDNREVA